MGSRDVVHQRREADRVCAGSFSQSILRHQACHQAGIETIMSQINNLLADMVFVASNPYRGTRPPAPNLRREDDRRT